MVFMGNHLSVIVVELFYQKLVKIKEEIITAEIDIEEDHLFRRNWGLFRDRSTRIYIKNY